MHAEKDRIFTVEQKELVFDLVKIALDVLPIIIIAMIAIIKTDKTGYFFDNAVHNGTMVMISIINFGCILIGRELFQCEDTLLNFLCKLSIGASILFGLVLYLMVLLQYGNDYAEKSIVAIVMSFLLFAVSVLGTLITAINKFRGKNRCRDTRL